MGASNFVLFGLVIVCISSAVSSIECPVCTNVPNIGASPCDSGNVKETCPFGLDKCMTITGKISVSIVETNFALKNCSNNILCDPDSEFNMCKILNLTGIVSSCSVTCTTPDTSGVQGLGISAFLGAMFLLSLIFSVF